MWIQDLTMSAQCLFRKFRCMWHCGETLSMLWQCRSQIRCLTINFSDDECVVNYNKPKGFSKRRGILHYVFLQTFVVRVSLMCWHLAVGFSLVRAKSIISIIIPMIKVMVMIMTQILTVASSWTSISSCRFNVVMIVNLESISFQLKKSEWMTFFNVNCPLMLAQVNWFQRAIVCPHCPFSTVFHCRFITTEKTKFNDL